MGMRKRTVTSMSSEGEQEREGEGHSIISKRMVSATAYDATSSNDHEDLCERLIRSVTAHNKALEATTRLQQSCMQRRTLARIEAKTIKRMKVLQKIPAFSEVEHRTINRLVDSDASQERGGGLS